MPPKPATSKKADQKKKEKVIEVCIFMKLETGENI